MTMRVFRRSVGGGPSLTSYEFTAPDHDFDLNIKFPSGKVVSIQARPSNADDDGYNGSLDIVLPENQPVTNWLLERMEPAPLVDNLPECHNAGQLGMELP